MNLKIKKAVERGFGVKIFRKSLPRGCDLFLDLRRIGFDPRVIFDVGANVGDFSLEAAGFFPKASIHAFEPVEATFKTLRERTSHLRRIELFRLALDLKGGNQDMAICQDSRMNTLCNSSRGSSTGKTETVETVRLDELIVREKIASIDLLKIDTEGADLRVLQGAELLLSDGKVGIIQVEAGVSPSEKRFVPFESFRDFLAPHGFHVFGIYDQSVAYLSFAIDYFNAVFIHSKLLPGSSK